MINDARQTSNTQNCSNGRGSGLRLSQTKELTVTQDPRNKLFKGSFEVLLIRPVYVPVPSWYDIFNMDAGYINLCTYALKVTDMSVCLPRSFSYFFR